MTLAEFFQKHIPANITIKIIWPDQNRSITGPRADMIGEIKLLRSYVFDWQLTDGSPGYNMLIWVTSDQDNLIFNII